MRSKTKLTITCGRLPRNGLAVAIKSAVLLLSGIGGASAASTPAVEHVEFNPAFFPGRAVGGQVDISRFNQGNVVLPGHYRADVYVNGNWIGREDLTFVAADGSASAQLCLEYAMLTKIGIDLENITEKAAQASETPTSLPDGPVCGDIGVYVPGASLDFDAGESRLEVQVPQLYMARTARGYVGPEHWDGGINAAFVRYNANTHMTTTHGSTSRSAYIGLNTGVNLGNWHFRHNGSYSSISGGGSGYQSASTYVQRDLPKLQSQLLAGEIFTSGELFDSVRLRGVSLFTDDRMLPDSQTGYAPVVRGVAETNARVAIRQRGFLLDEVNVAPGPFVIDDLSPTGYGGDLEVTITEADGRQRQYIVPFASNARLMRPGYGRYSVSLGEIDEIGLAHRPDLLEATYQRGLNNHLTGYLGGIAADGYRSQLLGTAFNTPVGAVSLDLTASRAQIPGHDTFQGRSVQLRYNKNFAETGTNFALGAFRYSTEGFLTALDAARLRSLAQEGDDLDGVGRLRDRLDLSLSQSVGRGSLYLTGSSQHYWNRGNGQLSFGAGYSNAWKRMHYTVSVERSRDLMTDRTSNQFSFMASVPLGHAARAPTLSTTLTHGDRRSARAGVSGSLGEHGDLTYGVSAGYTEGGGHNGNADVQYRGPFGLVNAGYSQGNDFRSASFGISSGVVAHPGDVTMAPELGDTIAIVHVPNAVGTRVSGSYGAKVGHRSYAVVPHLTPYRMNMIELDPKDISMDVELKTASQAVAPRAGAVVMLKYETSTGRAMLINALTPDGNPLPFGADVYDETGAVVGVVGQAGKMFVRVTQNSGELTVKWGLSEATNCRLPYAVGSEARSDRLHQANGTCQTAAAVADEADEEQSIESSGGAAN